MRDVSTFCNSKEMTHRIMAPSVDSKKTLVPLLIGKVQFSKLTNMYIPLYEAKLYLCSVYTIEGIVRKKCSTLVKAIKDNKYPELQNVHKKCYLRRRRKK